MTWQGRVEHAKLVAAAETLVSLLDDVPMRLRYGDVMHMFHAEAADRCQVFGVTLRSALALTFQDVYGPAFALLRTALEQVLVDKLVFLGRRVVRIISDVEDEVWERWQHERATGQGWQDVTDWRRSKKKTVTIIREGFVAQSEDARRGQVIGPHYFLLQEYSPFVGSPEAYAALDDGLSEPEERRAYAAEHKKMYEIYLRWSSLKANLQYNGFADDTTLSQLDCHYRFLSAFVHPISDTTRVLYGNNAHGSWPRYDHYSSELALLYTVVMAVEELRNFGRMIAAADGVTVAGWADIEQECVRAWELTSYLWFPGQAPHPHDRYDEANRRMFRQGRENGEHTRIAPDSIPDAEITYYANPMTRLIELHTSKSELMTGLSYISPWPRDDARFRH
jgi:hypothetical protein